jgi:hypothetical protein
MKMLIADGSNFAKTPKIDCGGVNLIEVTYTGEICLLWKKCGRINVVVSSSGE